MTLRAVAPLALFVACPVLVVACAEAAGVETESACPTCPGATAQPTDPSAGDGAVVSGDGAVVSGDGAAVSGDGATGQRDSADSSDAWRDGGGGDGAASDGAASDASTRADASDGGGGTVDAGSDASTGGVITGGPCISGAQGATAFRIRWTNGGGRATVSYEIEGLPDRSRSKAGAYGYSIGFVPQFVDPYLAQGGLQLDGSSFVDLELSTVGVSSISRATLSIYGRSFNTTASGSFNWQTFVDVGTTPTNFVSNVAPYQWYSADVTSAVAPNDNGMLMRIKAGPSSGALVVNRVELCLVAN